MPRPTTRSKFTNGEKVSILAIQALGGVSNAQIAQVMDVAKAQSDIGGKISTN